MEYRWIYKTNDNIDNIIMCSDGTYLTGLFFVHAKDTSKHNLKYEEKNLNIFKETSKWLDIYFSGNNPNFTPKYKINNLTPFKEEVINIMNNIPYGTTTTYGSIGKIIAKKRGIKKMSSQAVGHAVGSNPICIIVPCHRVIGKDGNLTGYGGGIKNKIELLKIEHQNMNEFFIPKKGKKL